MTVIVHGATGFTGSLVARALLAHGIRPVLVGRNESKLLALAEQLGGDFDTRAVEVANTDALYAALADADIVVNTAGPFTQLGEPVVLGALRAGAHYLDTTGEQAFMRDIYERYESAARKAEVCIVNGFAFEIAIGDWCAALAAEAMGATREHPLDELAVGYAVSGFAPTRGTKLSMVESIAAPGVVWQHDRWDPIKPSADTRELGFPDPFGTKTGVSFPSGEVITVPRHIRANRVQSYLAMDGVFGALTRRVGPLIGAVMRSPLRGVIAKTMAAGAPAPTDGQRKVTDFCIAAVAERGAKSEQVAASGADIYGITADIVALGVTQLAAGAHRRTGVLAPSEAFDPRTSLTAIDVTMTASF